MMLLIICMAKGYSASMVDSHKYGNTSHDLGPLLLVRVGVAD